MYLVSYEDFKTFTESEGIDTQVIITNTPCIIQFHRGDKIMAKVEVVNAASFKSGEKKKSDNKYWIRGKEWVDGVKELKLT